MDIRPARADESAKCAEIHTEARGRMEYLPGLYTPKETISWMRDVVFESDSVIVVEIDGALVGYASYAKQVVSNMYVLPEFQRRGAGSALLDFIVHQVPDGFELCVFEQNTEAIRFYEDRGFRTVSRTSGENEEQLPDRLMRL